MLNIHHLSGFIPYEQTLQQMQAYTNSALFTEHQLWLLEHLPVYTQGIAGKPEHLLNDNGLPVIQSDRGGQITWHGPGQLVGYLLINLEQAGWHVRDLVNFTEMTLINYLQQYGLAAYADLKAPGVYIDGKKIGSLGFKIRNQWSYHGFSLNVNADMHYFSTINPCGMAAMQMTNLCDFVPTATLDDTRIELARLFQSGFEDRIRGNT